MNLQELSSPIRMYWDIGPVSSLVSADYGRIASEIAFNKVLSLQITETGPVLSEACRAVLETLKEKPIALSLVAPLAALDERALEGLRRSSVKVVFAQTSSVDELVVIAERANRAGSNPAVGVSFPVSRENFQELPRLLRSCIDENVTHLLLPMQRLMTGAECFVFSRKERKELTALLASIKKPTWLKITIHDPFLWRAFYPEVKFPNGGCQAANTMLYISPDALVYPCPTVPMILGDLKKGSLKDVIFSDAKKKVREELRVAATPCIDCAELAACKGGCRGRAYGIHGTLQQNDPACR